MSWSSGRLDEGGQRVVEPAAAPQRPEDELVEEAAVALVERLGAGRGQGVGQR